MEIRFCEHRLVFAIKCCWRRRKEKQTLLISASTLLIVFVKRTNCKQIGVSSTSSQFNTRSIILFPFFITFKVAITRFVIYCLAKNIIRAKRSLTLDTELFIGIILLLLPLNIISAILRCNEGEKLIRRGHLDGGGGTNQ